jgi:sodium-independent sulfate anion transporter 11
MVDFISAPVISGFCSAAALTVASTQVKGLFGLKFSGSSFVEIWTGFFTNLSKINPWDAGLGCSSIVILLFMRVRIYFKIITTLFYFAFNLGNI